MMPWLAVVGLGEDGLAGLSPAARDLIDRAELLVGGARHLALVPEGGAERRGWAMPLSRTVDEILAWRGRRVVVLASGDPMWFGVGVTLARRIPHGEILVLPGLSAFSLACARLGWPLAEIECLTLHGRPLALLDAALAPGARLLLLSEDGTTPAAVAGRLAALGYGRSRLTVLEHMGGPQERRVDGIAADWPAGAIADLNTIAVECVAGPDALRRPLAPGLPDDAFRHDGQLTKRELRATVLAALAPQPGELLWDVGAGCGSVAIEWLRLGRRLSAIAIERDADRQALIEANAAALGTPHLRLVRGAAPAALADLPAPHAVFVGGGLATKGVLEAGRRCRRAAAWSPTPSRWRARPACSPGKARPAASSAASRSAAPSRSAPTRAGGR
ncbi:MAG: precorrin-6y C5,15-methyltransferase (decarboxylating) subunit CbiE [Dongiaceae bacterium]